MGLCGPGDQYGGVGHGRRMALVITSSGSSVVPMGKVRDFSGRAVESLLSFGDLYLSDTHEVGRCGDVNPHLEHSRCGFGPDRVGGGDEVLDSGYCYLDLVRDAHVDEVRNAVGPWPKVCELVEIPREMIDPHKMDASRAVKANLGWHFSRDGDVSVARLLQLAASRHAEELSEDSLGYALLGLWFGDEQYDFDGLAGGLLPSCAELTELYARDFSVCRCRVHEVPVTKSLPGAKLGCVQKSAGKSGVISGAYNGQTRMCHAEEGTRTQDQKLLGMILRPEDPMLLDGKSRPFELEELCTSSEHSDMSAFGNGYCYLALLHHDTWWRAARLLGPNPLLRSLYRFVVWLGKAASKKHVLIKVLDGYYHVAVDKASKGVINHAGRDICIQIADVIKTEPFAKVGGWSFVESLGLGIRDDPAPYRYDAVTMRHVVVQPSLELPFMSNLGPGGFKGSTGYLSSTAVDGWVYVGIDGPGSRDELVCWCLGPGYSCSVRQVCLNDGRSFEFPSEGGIAFWCTGGISATLQLVGLASIACRVRVFPHEALPMARV